MTNKALINLDIKKEFPDFSLDVKFNLAKGITALMGPSGSGKTTLANLIAGIEKPDDGFIKAGDHVFFDQSTKTCMAPELRKIGYVFQEGLLFPHMTVRQNLLYGTTKTSNPQLFETLVGLFDLNNLLNRYPEKLSGGEKRRVAIGRALLSEPDILILDEPLTGLDPARRQALFPFLDKLKLSFKGPILYISHHMDEVAHIADFGLLLNEGSLKNQGSIGKIFLEKDFSAYLGDGDSAALINGVIEGTHKGVTHINCNGLTLISTSNAISIGTEVRLRIFARDVALSLFKPEGISVLNCIPCTVDKIDRQGENEVIILLNPTYCKTGEQLLSKITKLSFEQLNIKKGQTIFAMIKAIAVTNS
jgi:molybdate transport system ATP-binding protein